MTREEAIKILKETLPYESSFAEARLMSIEALTAQEVTEKVTQELADKINDAYAKGYNAAKAEIALSGEYERAYQRGLEDAQKWIPCSEHMPETIGEYLITVQTNQSKKRITTAGYYYDRLKEFGTFRRDGTWEKWDAIAWMPLPEPYKEP